MPHYRVINKSFFGIFRRIRKMPSQWHSTKQLLQSVFSAYSLNQKKLVKINTFCKYLEICYKWQSKANKQRKCKRNTVRPKYTTCFFHLQHVDISSNLLVSHIQACQCWNKVSSNYLHNYIWFRKRIYNGKII